MAHLPEIRPLAPSSSAASVHSAASSGRNGMSGAALDRALDAAAASAPWFNTMNSQMLGRSAALAGPEDRAISEYRRIATFSKGYEYAPGSGIFVMFRDFTFGSELRDAKRRVENEERRKLILQQQEQNLEKVKAQLQKRKRALRAKWLATSAFYRSLVLKRQSSADLLGAMGVDASSSVAEVRAAARRASLSPDTGAGGGFAAAAAAAVGAREYQDYAAAEPWEHAEAHRASGGGSLGSEASPGPAPSGQDWQCLAPPSAAPASPSYPDQGSASASAATLPVRRAGELDPIGSHGLPRSAGRGAPLPPPRPNTTTASTWSLASAGEASEDSMARPRSQPLGPLQGHEAGRDGASREGLASAEPARGWGRGGAEAERPGSRVSFAPGLETGPEQAGGGGGTLPAAQQRRQQQQQPLPPLERLAPSRVQARALGLSPVQAAAGAVVAGAGRRWADCRPAKAEAARRRQLAEWKKQRQAQAAAATTAMAGTATATVGTAAAVTSKDVPAAESVVPEPEAPGSRAEPTAAELAPVAAQRPAEDAGSAREQPAPQAGQSGDSSPAGGEAEAADLAGQGPVSPVPAPASGGDQDGQPSAEPEAEPGALAEEARPAAPGAEQQAEGCPEASDAERASPQGAD